MTDEKLDIFATIGDGFRYGLKNFIPLLLAVVLYLLTFWIPYLNVGTTIGLYKIVIGIGRGETIDPLAIFSKENFRNLGGFFLLLGFLAIGQTAAMVFMFIPAIVLSLAWGMAVYFFIDKKVSPLKALQLSYDSTYGNKWRIFFIGLLLSVVASVALAVLGAIPKAGVVLAVIAMVLMVAIIVAVWGVMYNFFSRKADAILFGRENKCCSGAPEREEPAVMTEA